ncbi:MAG TPA: hypothetical protein VE866_01745 [Candidatus Binatia bacterium]|nr:hypothetical protein [Candidatus Binatia bacterium]
MSISNAKGAFSASVLTLASGKEVSVFVGQVNAESISFAESILASTKKKSFGCACCGKRVAISTETRDAVHMALLFSSRLCFDCWFWLQKACDPRFKIINGFSYSFDGKVQKLDRHALEALTEQKLKHLNPSSFLVKNLATGEYELMSQGWVMQQGEVNKTCRRYLPDTHKWVCPLCLEPMHEHPGNGEFGYICETCKIGIASAQVDRWINGFAKKKPAHPFPSRMQPTTL